MSETTFKHVINFFEEVVSADHSKPCDCCRCRIRRNCVAQIRTTLDKIKLEKARLEIQQAKMEIEK